MAIVNVNSCVANTERLGIEVMKIKRTLKSKVRFKNHFLNFVTLNEVKYQQNFNKNKLSFCGKMHVSFAFISLFASEFRKR
jgi:hypothetical protein